MISDAGELLAASTMYVLRLCILLHLNSPDELLIEHHQDIKAI